MLARLRYHFDNWISWRASARFVIVLGLGIFALVFGAVLLRVLAPDSEPAASFLEALWWSWGRVADPGSGAGDTGRGVRIAEILTTLSGLFLFALLIGFVSSVVEEKLGELRKGRSRVVERGHVVVLGFGEKALRIVAQLAEANAHHPDFCVVILSTMEKEAVMEAVLARFGGPRIKTTRVVVRNGEPWSPVALRSVGAPTARSVILLAEDGASDGDGDVRVVKSLLALMRGLERPLAGHVVVELHDSGHRDVVEAIGGDRIEVVVAEAFLARLLVQTARQSGLARVYADLLSFEGEELYLLPVPDALVGKTFGDAWASLPMAVVVGVEPKAHDPGEIVRIAPPDETILNRGDELLVIVPDDTTPLVPARMKASAALPRRSRDPVPRKAERFLLVGFEEDMGEMLEEIDHYVADGSEAVVLTPLAPDECARRLAPSVRRLSRLTPRFAQGDSTSLRDLEPLCERGFDAEILIADEAEPRSPDDADARTLMTLVLLRKLAHRRGHAGVQRVISEIRNPRTKELAAVAEVGDFVVSDELVSDFLAHVAERREIADAWAHLRHDEGHEVFLKPTWRYAEEGETVTFADLTARARARGEIMLGYVRGKGKESLVLNPTPKDAPLAFGADDRLVVVADRED
jgi:hypothetical protein